MTPAACLQASAGGDASRRGPPGELRHWRKQCSNSSGAAAGAASPFRWLPAAMLAQPQKGRQHFARNLSRKQPARQLRA